NPSEKINAIHLATEVSAVRGKFQDLSVKPGTEE
ncbi:hypothetical protein CCACVL1_11864, partial [Corchorus capsularis]